MTDAAVTVHAPGMSKSFWPCVFTICAAHSDIFLFLQWTRLSFSADWRRKWLKWLRRRCTAVTLVRVVKRRFQPATCCGSIWHVRNLTSPIPTWAVRLVVLVFSFALQSEFLSAPMCSSSTSCTTKPWQHPTTNAQQIESFVAFPQQMKQVDFELYLSTASRNWQILAYFLYF